MIEPWTWHGGAIDAARRAFPDAPDAWIDLSTGINPLPWPGAASVAIDWQTLPGQAALAELEAAAAAHFGIDPRHVCAVPGTELALRAVGRTIGGSAHYVAPAYRTHGAMIDGARPIAADDAAACPDTLILANPNNPDGRRQSRQAMAALLDRRPADSWLLVDEAFADADRAISLADAIGDGRRLVVFRSFGKFFGLAGVRLGFVLGPQGLLNELRAAFGAWPVSAAAIAIGTAAYRDRAWIEATCDTLPHRTAALDALLTRAGLRPIGECPLFRLVETDHAAAIFKRLAANAILCRPFADQPRWLRFGLLKDAAALARLERALANG
ncbi:aminotransferase class I/II-fold pyridoxal phosphate-dependent enzyme [Sphingomonas sp. RS6]